MPIIGLSDFKGEYNIAINPDNEPKVLAIIERREKEIMKDLLGLTLYNRVKATTIAGGNDTDDPLLTYIFEEFQYEAGCHVLNSEGMKFMLANMIYVFIAREGYISNTSIGDRVNVSEVSIGVNWTKAVLNYNTGIKTYRAIQSYIHHNSIDYEDYLGVCMEYMGII
jgi:hypothetical protein